MRCIFQIIRPDNGQRSPGMECDRTKFAELLVGDRYVLVGGVRTDDLVLVVAEAAEPPGDGFVDSLCPLMRVDSFVRMFHPLRVECSHVEDASAGSDAWSDSICGSPAG